MVAEAEAVMVAGAAAGVAAGAAEAGFLIVAVAPSIAASRSAPGYSR